MRINEKGLKRNAGWSILEEIHRMENYSIFIVEDDPWYGEILEYHLSLNPDYHIRRFETGKDCIANLHRKPSLITMDYSLPDYL